mmetsp:Transcript_34803/g.80152  ORF Transcript_34803/g.80152 Transcript_34803/m.80152 type:complete len:230 (-) Transcript_34803:64-753(-)
MEFRALVKVDPEFQHRLHLCSKLHIFRIWHVVLPLELRLGHCCLNRASLGTVCIHQMPEVAAVLLPALGSASFQGWVCRHKLTGDSFCMKFSLAVELAFSKLHGSQEANGGAVFQTLLILLAVLLRKPPRRACWHAGAEFFLEAILALQTFWFYLVEPHPVHNCQCEETDDCNLKQRPAPARPPGPVTTFLVSDIQVIHLHWLHYQVAAVLLRGLRHRVGSELSGGYSH